MQVSYTAADLISFEDEVAALFADKRIAAPVHLTGGNENQLIRIFREHVNAEDWVLCSWRSHYHCLLKGVPPDQLRASIIAGRSISLCFPEYRILSSGIVGGTAPIAVGLAMGIKRKRNSLLTQKSAVLQPGFWREEASKPGRKVVCFIGDMAAESGIAHESVKYAVNHDLPVLFVIEDNGLSVSTSTRDVWGSKYTSLNSSGCEGYQKVLWYRYQLTRPHVGIGKYVAF